MTSTVTHLGEVCDFIRGITFPSDDARSIPFANSIPCLTTSAVQEAVAWNSRRFVPSSAVRNERQIVRAGDILISTANSKELVGKSCLVSSPPYRCSFGAFVTVARPKDAVYPSYLAYWMSSREFLSWCFQRSSNTTNISNLRTSDLEELPFPYRDINEQQQIARRLEKADHLRGMRRYALHMCDELLPASFLKIFGDPASNPRGYSVVPGEHLFDEARGGAKCGPFGSALRNSEYVNFGIPVWTMENVQANHFIEGGSLFITDKKFQQLKAYAVVNGDILISRAGTVGRMAIVRTHHDRSIMHSNLIRLALNRALVAPEYFVTLMTWFGSRVAKLKTGQEDAYTFMNTGTLAELPIPLPPADTQKTFVSFVRQHEQFRATHVEALRQADHLFQTLLHDAFSDAVRQ